MLDFLFQVVLSALLAVAAAKPGIIAAPAVAYSAPLAYSAPIVKTALPIATSYANTYKVFLFIFLLKKFYFLKIFNHNIIYKKNYKKINFQ